MTQSIETRKPKKGKRSFYISDELWFELLQYADQYGVSGSSIICKMIRVYINKQKKDIAIIPITSNPNTTFGTVIEGTKND